MRIPVTEPGRVASARIVTLVALILLSGCWLQTQSSAPGTKTQGTETHNKETQDKETQDKEVKMSALEQELQALFDDFAEHGEPGRLRQALDLVEDSSVEPNATKPEFIAFRAEKFVQLLRVVNHADARIIPGFDLEALPPMTAAPPPESGMPAGVDPQGIQDPKMKAQYEQSIAENQSEREQFALQSKLHAIQRDCVEAISDHVSESYSDAPQHTEELKAQINEHIDSVARKASLGEVLLSAERNAEF